MVTQFLIAGVIEVGSAFLFSGTAVVAVPQVREDEILNQLSFQDESHHPFDRSH